MARVLLSLACVLTVAVYLPLRSAPYVYEDVQTVTGADAPQVWWAPSRALTFWTLRQTPTPASAHLGNVAIHLVNGGLVAALGLAVAGPEVAALTASVFLLHPLNSEAVAYVTGRAELLVTMGALLAVLGAVRGWWALVALGLAVSVLSKEVGAAALLLVALTLAAWRRWAALAMIAALAVGGVVLTRHTVMGWLTMPAGKGGSAAPIGDYLGIQAAAVWGLLARVLVPVNQTIDHDWLTTPRVWGSTALALLIGAAWAVAAWWRAAPRVAWGLGWLLLAVLPRFVVRQDDGLHEQHIYLAMVPVSLGLGALLAWRLETRTAVA